MPWPLHGPSRSQIRSIFVRFSKGLRTTKVRLSFRFSPANAVLTLFHLGVVLVSRVITLSEAKKFEPLRTEKEVLAIQRGSQELPPHLQSAGLNLLRSFFYVELDILSHRSTSLNIQTFPPSSIQNGGKFNRGKFLPRLLVLVTFF